MDWQHYKEVLIPSYGSVILEMVVHNKLHHFSHKGYVEEYANEFHRLCSCMTKFPFSTSERFLAGLKEDVSN